MKYNRCRKQRKCVSSHDENPTFQMCVAAGRDKEPVKETELPYL